MKTVSKIMIVLACGIIMLHAVVPHHHHEGGGGVECFCQHHHHEDDGHSHSPFDLCKLQDMLSHVVICAKDDEEAFEALVSAESHAFIFWAIPVRGDDLCLTALPAGEVSLHAFSESIGVSPLVGAAALRAPPQEA